MDTFIQVLAQGILIGGSYGLVALGMAIIFSVSGIVNFAHGDFLTIGMYLCFSLYAALGLDPYVSAFIVFPVLAILGIFFFIFLVQPLLGQHHLMVIQMTLALTFIFQNLLLMTYGGQLLRIPSVVENSLWLIGDLVIRVSQLIAFGVSVLLAGLLFWVLNSTDFGRSVRAVNQQPKAAALMGINVKRIRLIVFAIGTGVLAIAAALLLPGTPIQLSQGLHFTVLTLLVPVLGGMSNFVGFMLGGFLIGLSEAIGAVYVSGTLGMMLPYAIFALTILFRPTGLLKAS